MKTDNGGQQKLVPENELIDFAPHWFKEALAKPMTTRRAAFRGAEVNFKEWPKPHDDAPGIVFLHGDSAHSHWFDFVAPLLAEEFHIIAPDMPGMGDSGWLDAYSRDIMAEGVIAAARAAGFTRKPALVAHSFGGMIGLIAASRHADELAALLLCDFLVRPPETHVEWYTDFTGRPTRIYPTLDDNLKRFRLTPEQPCANQFILDHIARHSVREAEGGWTWKFDPSIYVGFTIGNDLPDIFSNLTCPLAVMCGELSTSDGKISERRKAVDYMRGLRTDIPFYDIPEAHHHIMLDRPHAFAAAVAAQMAVWRANGAFAD